MDAASVAVTICVYSASSVSGYHTWLILTGARCVRRNETLSLIGFLIGAEAGARLGHELGIAVSPVILLGRVRQSSATHTKTEVSVCVPGVDAFAGS